MPPVMEAGAFLMASFLGLQYSEIMIAAYTPMRTALLGIGLARLVSFFNFKPETAKNQKILAVIAALIFLGLGILFFIKINKLLKIFIYKHYNNKHLEI